MDPKLYPEPHQQNDATGTTSVYQESPKVNQFKRDGSSQEVEVQVVRDTAKLAGIDQKTNANFSQHRAADKFEDYGFKNLARGNYDDLQGTTPQNSYSYNSFVKNTDSVLSSERGGVQTPTKTDISKNIVIQRNSPEEEEKLKKANTNTYNYNVPVEKERNLVNSSSSSSTSQGSSKSFMDYIGGFERSYILPVDRNFRKIGHAGLTAAIFLGSLKMNKGVVPALKAAGLGGLVSGLVINPELFNPLLSKPMYYKNS